MTIQDIRRSRLAKLIADRFGSQAEFVLTTGENQGEVSGLLKSKSFGEKKARKLEVKCGLPQGWFDDMEMDYGGNVVRADEPTPFDTGIQDVDHPQWMAPEAFRLLSLYYSADADGRAEIMNTALDYGRIAGKNVVHNKA